MAGSPRPEQSCLAAEQQTKAPRLHRNRRSENDDDLQQRARCKEIENAGHVMLLARAIDSDPGSGNRRVPASGVLRPPATHISAD